MSRNCLIVFISMIAVAVEARILPETLVVCQCQFYPLREQQRGYLGRYVDQPLFLDPDLPLDGAIADKSYLKTWNSFYGSRDGAAAREGLRPRRLQFLLPQLARLHVDGD